MRVLGRGGGIGAARVPLGSRHRRSPIVSRALRTRSFASGLLTGPALFRFLKFSPAIRQAGFSLGLPQGVRPDLRRYSRQL